MDLYQHKSCLDEYLEVVPTKSGLRELYSNSNWWVLIPTVFSVLQVGLDDTALELSSELKEHLRIIVRSTKMYQPSRDKYKRRHDQGGLNRPLVAYSLVLTCQSANKMSLLCSHKHGVQLQQDSRGLSRCEFRQYPYALCRKGSGCGMTEDCYKRHLKLLLTNTL